MFQRNRLQAQKIFLRNRAFCGRNVRARRRDGCAIIIIYYIRPKRLGFGPVGWKAWCAYVLGGAVVGSLDNAIEQLWPDDDNEKK